MYNFKIKSNEKCNIKKWKVKMGNFQMKNEKFETLHNI